MLIDVDVKSEPGEDGDKTPTKGPCDCGYRHWYKGKEVRCVFSLSLSSLFCWLFYLSVVICLLYFVICVQVDFVCMVPTPTGHKVLGYSLDDNVFDVAETFVIEHDLARGTLNHNAYESHIFNILLLRHLYYILMIMEEMSLLHFTSSVLYLFF